MFAQLDHLIVSCYATAEKIVFSYCNSLTFDFITSGRFATFIDLKHVHFHRCRDITMDPLATLAFITLQDAARRKGNSW